MNYSQKRLNAIRIKGETYKGKRVLYVTNVKFLYLHIELDNEFQERITFVLTITYYLLHSITISSYEYNIQIHVCVCIHLKEIEKHVFHFKYIFSVLC